MTSNNVVITMVKLSQSTLDFFADIQPKIIRPELVEEFDTQKARYAKTIASEYIKKSKKQSPISHEAEVRGFIKYCDEMIANKKVIVKYNFGKGKYHGRLVGSKVQNMPSEFRHFFFGDTTTDVDMVNCHPTILRYLCHKHSIICPNLNYYVANRQAVFNDFGDKTKCKRLINIAMFSDELKTSNKFINHLNVFYFNSNERM